MKITLIVCCMLFAFAANASFVSDTGFISYEVFLKLSKKEIKKQFGSGKPATIIKEHYHQERSGLWWLVPTVIFNGGGTYFAILSANAGNGMGSMVGLVLSIILFIPGLISTFFFLRYLFRKKPSKENLYKMLRQYHTGSSE